MFRFKRAAISLGYNTGTCDVFRFILTVHAGFVGGIGITTLLLQIACDGTPLS